jgi:uncharacterized protein
VRRGIVLTHGAGSNANAPLLLAFDRAFSANGYLVVRYDLLFRQLRKTGPPHPSGAARDRAGLREAVLELRKSTNLVVLGGHSYGGRQASMLAADEPELVPALLLLSYPLHPPAKPEQLRTEHFAKLRTPALFVHGDRDPFGTPDEMSHWVRDPHQLEIVPGAGHDLKYGKFGVDAVVNRFQALVDRVSSVGASER